MCLCPKAMWLKFCLKMCSKFLGGSFFGPVFSLSSPGTVTVYRLVPVGLTFVDCNLLLVCFVFFGPATSIGLFFVTETRAFALGKCL